MIVESGVSRVALLREGAVQQKLRTMIAMVFFALAVCGVAAADQPSPNPAAAVLKSHIMKVPADVPWGPCPAAVPAGAQCAVVEGDLSAPDRLFAFRLKMPSGYRIPPHFHPADEHLVVVQGTFNMGSGDVFDMKTTKPMVTGSFVVMPKGAHHFAWTEGETILHIYAIGPWGITFVNPLDDPRNRKKTSTQP